MWVLVCCAGSAVVEVVDRFVVGIHFVDIMVIVGMSIDKGLLMC